MARKLTDMQLKFVNEYLLDLNATQAAKRAGYKDPNIGRQLITKNNVLEAIQKQQKKLQSKTEITQERILNELANIAFSAATDFAIMGAPIVKDAEHKTGNKLKALEMLGKHLGLFEGKEEGKRTDEPLSIHYCYEENNDGK